MEYIPSHMPWCSQSLDRPIHVAWRSISPFYSLRPSERHVFPFTLNELSLTRPSLFRLQLDVLRANHYIVNHSMDRLQTPDNPPLTLQSQEGNPLEPTSLQVPINDIAGIGHDYRRPASYFDLSYCTATTTACIPRTPDNGE